ncbi:hypothetical protein KC19_4G270200 [Ceratodon purpureus]|uniref:Uncharacterized protein n=1 Tax=Ceratodon purpureus TaxID=3225 RepID=A0A8T0IFQ8_CERPU|nr:hypothetical protein KC19_4G270200 [Ceratodon purpureus]
MTKICFSLLTSVFRVVLQVWTAKVSTLFEFSSVGALFFLIYTYSLSLTTMAFALSTVFSKAQTAGALSGLLMLFSSLAVIPIELLHLPAPVCAFLALFSPAGFAMAINVVVRAEGRGRGVHMLGRRNFWSRVVPFTSQIFLVQYYFVKISDLLCYRYSVCGFQLLVLLDGYWFGLY